MRLRKRTGLLGLGLAITLGLGISSNSIALVAVGDIWAHYVTGVVTGKVGERVSVVVTNTSDNPVDIDIVVVNVLEEQIGTTFTAEEVPPWATVSYEVALPSGTRDKRAVLAKVDVHAEEVCNSPCTGEARAVVNIISRTTQGQQNGESSGHRLNSPVEE